MYLMSEAMTKTFLLSGKSLALHQKKNKAEANHFYTFVITCSRLDCDNPYCTTRRILSEGKNIFLLIFLTCTDIIS